MRLPRYVHERSGHDPRRALMRTKFPGPEHGGGLRHELARSNLSALNPHRCYRSWSMPSLARSATTQLTANCASHPHLGTAEIPQPRQCAPSPRRCRKSTRTYSRSGACCPPPAGSDTYTARRDAGVTRTAAATGTRLTLFP